MGPSEHDHGGPPLTDRLVTYSRRPEETAVEAIVMAFEAIDADVTEREKSLHDCFPTDAVNRLVRGDAVFRLRLSVWGHPLVLTPEAVTVYAAPSE